jgi:phosphoglycolate phosphatase
MPAIEIDLLVFDLDGTLVDTKDIIIASINRTLVVLGKETKPHDEIAANIGEGVWNLIQKSLRPRDEEELSRAIAIFKNDYQQRAAAESKLFPKVIEVLDHFKDKIKVIVSNSFDDTVKVVVRARGIDKYFKLILGGSDRNCLKPSPCPLDRILNQFQVAKSRCLMVGDMAIDIDTGKQAGVHTCAVTYGIGKKKELLESGPEFIIDDLSDLKKIVL